MSFDDEPTRLTPRVPQPPPGQPHPPAGAPRAPREPHPPAGPREPHPPAGPRAAGPGADPPGAVPPGTAGAPAAWAQDPRLTVIEDRLSSLRTALYAFAAVAVVALGLAFWALLDGGASDSESSTRGGAGTSALRERVSKLEDRLEDRATKGDVEEVSQGVSALSKRVSALPTTTTTTTPDDADADAVDPAEVTALQGDVQDLQQQVQSLEQAAAAAGAGTGDDGGADSTTP